MVRIRVGVRVRVRVRVRRGVMNNVEGTTVVKAVINKKET